MDNTGAFNTVGGMPILTVDSVGAKPTVPLVFLASRKIASTFTVFDPFDEVRSMFPPSEPESPGGGFGDRLALLVRFRSLLDNKLVFLVWLLAKAVRPLFERVSILKTRPRLENDEALSLISELWAVATDGVVVPASDRNTAPFGSHIVEVQPH